MTERFILALDAGTSSSRAIVFDRAGRPLVSAQREFPQHYPRPGWVEHDPRDIFDSQIAVAREAVDRAAIDGASLAAIGLTNQRETVVVWERTTGEPIHNAIVWQDRRTAAFCDQLRADGWERPIREKTGLVPDPYFSATKLRWILDEVPGARTRAERGELCFGTVDSWLLWHLTGGTNHATDLSNASRTMLFNIHTLQWDHDLLRELRIPPSLLPAVLPSSADFGETDGAIFGRSVPIRGIAGDQQAATVGQACFAPGSVKTTYGTGNFMLMNTGREPKSSDHGLLTTIAWGLNGEVTYALEGSIFTTGATVQWLRDELGLIAGAAESGPLAASVPDTSDVYLVPAFTGLGTPHWDAAARGTLIGLTRGTTRAHIVRAALESVAFSTRDILDAMRADSRLPIATLRVDGGMVPNDFLMQFQADITGAQVDRPAVTETTALGAAYLAGLSVGYWDSTDEITANWRLERTFTPQMGEDERERRYARWLEAVERARGWAR
jgi:glycerol kinase